MNFLHRLFGKQKFKWLFYDIEIAECIPGKYAPEDPNLKFCGGWDDHEHMTVSCIASYTNWDNAYRVFTSEQLADFQKLVNRTDKVIGFNSRSFDDKVCAANGLNVHTDFDLLSETWVAAGLPAVYTPGTTTSGYSLEKLAQANFGSGKLGHGELAPVLWQQGKRQAVEIYCLGDVYLSVALLRRGWAGELIDPVNGKKLALRKLH